MFVMVRTYVPWQKSLNACILHKSRVPWTLREWWSQHFVISLIDCCNHCRQEHLLEAKIKWSMMLYFWDCFASFSDRFWLFSDRFGIIKFGSFPTIVFGRLCSSQKKVQISFGQGWGSTQVDRRAKLSRSAPALANLFFTEKSKQKRKRKRKKKWNKIKNEKRDNYSEEPLPWGPLLVPAWMHHQTNCWLLSMIFNQ